MGATSSDEDNVWVDSRISVRDLSKEECVLAGIGLMRDSVLELLKHLLDSGVVVMDLHQLHGIIANAEMELGNV